jgi:hypothetical protein
VRHVREERAERDHELDAELARQLDDLVAEGAPAQVRLDAEHEHRVALRAGDGRVVEDRVRPVDPARDALFECDMRPRRLEVVELFRIDVGEAPCLPRLGEEAGRQRSALSPVVPAPESPHEHGAAKGRAPLDAEMAADGLSLGQHGP